MVMHTLWQIGVALIVGLAAALLVVGFIAVPLALVLWPKRHLAEPPHFDAPSSGEWE